MRSAIFRTLPNTALTPQPHSTVPPTQPARRTLTAPGGRPTLAPLLPDELWRDIAELLDPRARACLAVASSHTWRLLAARTEVDRTLELVRWAPTQMHLTALLANLHCPTRDQPIVLGACIDRAASLGANQYGEPVMLLPELERQILSLAERLPAARRGAMLRRALDLRSDPLDAGDIPGWIARAKALRPKDCAELLQAIWSRAGAADATQIAIALLLLDDEEPTGVASPAAAPCDADTHDRPEQHLVEGLARGDAQARAAYIAKLEALSRQHPWTTRIDPLTRWARALANCPDDAAWEALDRAMAALPESARGGILAAAIGPTAPKSVFDLALARAEALPGGAADQPLVALIALAVAMPTPALEAEAVSAVLGAIRRRPPSTCQAALLALTNILGAVALSLVPAIEGQLNASLAAMPPAGRAAWLAEVARSCRALDTSLLPQTRAKGKADEVPKANPLNDAGTVVMLELTHARKLAWVLGRVAVLVPPHAAGATPRAPRPAWCAEVVRLCLQGMTGPARPMSLELLWPGLASALAHVEADATEPVVAAMREHLLCRLDDATRRHAWAWMQQVSGHPS